MEFLSLEPSWESAEEFLDDSDPEDGHAVYIPNRRPDPDTPDNDMYMDVTNSSSPSPEAEAHDGTPQERDGAPRPGDSEEEPEFTFTGENPMLNSVVLDRVLHFTSAEKRQLRDLRLVCSTWNIEIMRRFQSRRLIVRAGKREQQQTDTHGIYLVDSIEVFKNKSINPLFTKFIFEVDVTDPLFLEFLHLAGEHTDEVMAAFRNTDKSIAVLREVLRILPNLATLGVNLKKNMRQRLEEQQSVARTSLEERFGALARFVETPVHLNDATEAEMAGLALEDDEPPQARMNEERHLFPEGVTPVTYPNIKHINFHATIDCKFKTLARDLILAAPNLEEFESTNFGGSGTAGQVVRIEKWFFQTVVLDPEFPTLTKLKRFNRVSRIQYTNVELTALLNRRFPLTHLVLTCLDPTISEEILENLFKQLGSTLKKLELTLTPEDHKKARDLSKCVQNLNKLEHLVAENFHVSLGMMCTDLPRLVLLNIRHFDASTMTSYVPQPRSIHPLQELHLRDPTAGHISVPLIRNVNLLFPKIRELTLSSEAIEFGGESLVNFTTESLKNLRFLSFFRKSNTLCLQLRKSSDGFISKRFNDLGFPTT